MESRTSQISAVAHKLQNVVGRVSPYAPFGISGPPNS